MAAGGVTTPASEAGFVVSRLLKRASPMMKGDDVRELQAALIKRGYACGRSGATVKRGTYNDMNINKALVLALWLAQGRFLHLMEKENPPSGIIRMTGVLLTAYR